MSGRGWPDGNDPVAAAVRLALEEAQQRLPDDVTLRRGWAAFDAQPAMGRRGAGLSWFAGGMASTAVLALACAAWLWPRIAQTPPERPQAHAPTQAPAGSETRRLTLEGGVEAELQRSSVMRIEGSDARVEGGAVRFKVPHRRPGHPFVVRADRYRVVVIGTRFGVTVGGDRRVDVDVDEGIVEVWNADDRVARLEPGQRWDSTSTAEGPAPEGAAKDGKPDSDRAADKAADKLELPRTEPAQKLSPSPEPDTSWAIAPRDPHRRHTSRGAMRVAVVATPSREATESPRAARDALAAGDAPRALQIYRNLAQKTGPVAENASYEIGRILNERGQSGAAVAAWRRYRNDYPNGILRVEADVSIIETLARAGESDDALGEATDFVRRRPDSERRGEIARLTGDLYRARGDCRRAVGAYQVALGASHARDVTESATFGRAACLVRLGDAGGVDAVRGYLRAYPEGRFRRQATELVEQAATKR